jgi:hypothetical protein
MWWNPTSVSHFQDQRESHRIMRSHGEKHQFTFTRLYGVKSQKILLLSPILIRRLFTPAYIWMFHYSFRVQWSLYIPSFLTHQKGRAVAQAVRRWLSNAAARVRVRAACGVCGTGVGFFFFRILRFPLPIIPPVSPSSKSPGVGTIGHWWPQCRVDSIGLHPSLDQLKKSNTPKLCILPTECICVFHMVLTVNSDCFPKQH